MLYLEHLFIHKKHTYSVFQDEFGTFLSHSDGSRDGHQGTSAGTKVVRAEFLKCLIHQEDNTNLELLISDYFGEDKFKENACSDEGEKILYSRLAHLNMTNQCPWNLDSNDDVHLPMRIW